MKKQLLMAAAALAAAFTAHAGIDDSAAAAFLTRAAEMYDNGNYRGCLDQLTIAESLGLLPAEAEQALYRRALATQHTDMALATVLFEDFLAQYPGSPLRPLVLFQLGNCWYGRDYAKALAYYDKVYDRALDDNQYEDICYRMAFCCLEEGSYADADGLFDALRFSKRYAPVAAFYRGYIAYRQGDFPKALQFFNDADTSVAPGNMVDFYSSQIYFSRGDYQKALTLSKKALAISDMRTEFVAEAARIAGESAFHLGDDAQSAKYLSYYTQLVETPLPSAQYILGLYAYNSADYPLAIRYLTPVTECADAMGQAACLYLGQAYLNSGDSDAAVLAFDKALHMDYDMGVKETAYYNYAVASVDGGLVPFGSAVATFTDFLRLFPDSRYAPQVQDYIITSYITDNNYEAALQSINGMAHPSDATLAAKQRVLYVLGTKALAASDDAKALQYLTESASLSKYNKEVATQTQLSLGEALYRDGKYAEAATAIGKYLAASTSKSSNYQIAQYDLGYALFAQKDYARAADAFAKAVNTKGSLTPAVLADATNRLADCYYAQKDFTKAADAYGKSYRLNPDAGDYPLLQEALMAGYQRNYTDKVRLIDNMLEKFPSSALIPDALLEKCEAYIQLSQPDKAVETYRVLVERYPNTAQGRQGYLQMALTLLNSGNRADALEAYRQVIRNYPSSEEAAIAVDKMKALSAEDGTLAQFTAFVNSIDGAPRIEESEVEQITFAKAEEEYLAQGKTRRLLDYMAAYPSGAARPRALAYLIEYEYDEGDRQKAYGYANDFVSQYPDNALAMNAYRVKGEVEESDGRNILALHSWTKLEEIASTPQMLALARQGVMRTGRAAESDADVKRAADALLQTVVAGTDEYNHAVFSEGWLLQRQDRHADARRQWLTIADNTDNLYGMRSAFSIGESYFAEGNLDEALKWAEKVSKAPSPHKYWVARGFILLSDILKAKGEDYKARQYLESLRANYPGSETDIFTMIDQRL